MRGRGYSTYSVCLSVTALAGATRTLRPQLRYQKKALDARIKYAVGIELKFLSSKVMTVAHREYFSRRFGQQLDTRRLQTLQKDFWRVKRCF